MGGTSTDVSRFAGHYEHVFESSTAGVTIQVHKCCLIYIARLDTRVQGCAGAEQAPQLDINTVAAGGGSRLFFRAGLFQVGPESCGAHPGPVCYRCVTSSYPSKHATATLVI